jgi:hypothetical protein
MISAASPAPVLSTTRSTTTAGTSIGSCPRRSTVTGSAPDFTIVIAAPVLTATAVLDHLLSAGNLSATDLRYLDLLGNRNGRLDVGDVRAWLSVATPAGADELRAVVQPNVMQSTERAP